MTNTRTFADRLSLIVDGYGGPRAMSRATDIDNASLSRYCRGLAYPDFMTLQKLGRERINLDYLIMGRVSKSRPNKGKQ